jgi:adenosine kinase
MANAAELSFRSAGEVELTIISPNDPTAMLQYVDECRTLGIPFIFDPGQQCARMSGEELAQGLAGAAVLILNDYELEILRQKTGLDEQALAEQTGMLVVTRGEHGSSLITAERQVDVPAVAPHRIVDPTGVGDAFRGGFMKGLVVGAGPETCGRLGSVAATYVLEHLGGTSHVYTREEFASRYAAHFGALPVDLDER